MTILTEHMSSASCEPEQREGADAPSQAEPQQTPGAALSAIHRGAQRSGDQSKNAASSKLKHWQTLAALLLGYAQTLVRLEKTSDARAWQVAGELEISTRSSLALCMKDIHALHHGDPPSTEEECDAFERLHAIASGLLALSYFIRKIKRGLAGRGVAGCITESAVARPLSYEVSCCPSPVYDIPELDPGWIAYGSPHAERRRRMMTGSTRAISFDVSQDERYFGQRCSR